MTAQPTTRLVAATALVAALVLTTPPPASTQIRQQQATQQLQEPQPERFQLTFRKGDPSVVGFEWIWESPNLLQVMADAVIRSTAMFADLGRAVEMISEN